MPGTKSQRDYVFSPMEESCLGGGGLVMSPFLGLIKASSFLFLLFYTETRISDKPTPLWGFLMLRSTSEDELKDGIK